METRSTLITWQENIALQRYQMIAPLLEADLDDAKKIQRRKEIAVEMSVTEHTVKKHTGNIFSKMDVTSRAELFALADEI